MPVKAPMTGDEGSDMVVFVLLSRRHNNAFMSLLSSNALRVIPQLMSDRDLVALTCCLVKDTTTFTFHQVLKSALEKSEKSFLLQHPCPALLPLFMGLEE